MNENNILTLQDLTKWNQEGVTDEEMRAFKENKEEAEKKLTSF